LITNTFQDKKFYLIALKDSTAYIESETLLTTGGYDE